MERPLTSWLDDIIRLWRGEDDHILIHQMGRTYHFIVVFAAVGGIPVVCVEKGDGMTVCVVCSAIKSSWSRGGGSDQGESDEGRKLHCR